MDKKPQPGNINIVTIGSFDGVHLGHQAVLEHISALADKVNGKKIVVTFDPHPRKIIGKHHEIDILTTTTEKIALLKSYGIDEVVVVPFTKDFSNLSADAYVAEFLVAQLQTKYLVIGFDHKFGKNRTGDINFLLENAKKYGFEIIEIPPNTLNDLKVSSTKIRTAILQSNFDAAIELLGHPYIISGKVVLGQQVGRTIGFPTANIEIKEQDKLIPNDGIYAASAFVRNKRYQGMLYIGHRPTIDDKLQRSIELNLFDFEESIYGEEIVIEIQSFVRPDRKLESLEALKKQIAQDKLVVLEKFAVL